MHVCCVGPGSIQFRTMNMSTEQNVMVTVGQRESFLQLLYVFMDFQAPQMQSCQPFSHISCIGYSQSYYIHNHRININIPHLFLLLECVVTLLLLSFHQTAVCASVLPVVLNGLLNPPQFRVKQAGCLGVSLSLLLYPLVFSVLYSFSFTPTCSPT